MTIYLSDIDNCALKWLTKLVGNASASNIQRRATADGEMMDVSRKTQVSDEMMSSCLR